MTDAWRALAAGVVGAAAGVLTWLGLAYALHALDPYRTLLSGVPWGAVFVGAGVGVGVRVRANLAPRRVRLLVAVGVTVVASNVGKLLTDEAAVVGLAHAVLARAAVTPEELIGRDAYRVAAERTARGEAVVWPEPGGRGGPDDFPPGVWAEAAGRWDALTDAERTARLTATRDAARASAWTTARMSTRMARMFRPVPFPGSPLTWVDVWCLGVAVGFAAFVAARRGGGV